MKMSNTPVKESPFHSRRTKSLIYPENQVEFPYVDDEGGFISFLDKRYGIPGGNSIISWHSDVGFIECDRWDVYNCKYTLHKVVDGKATKPIDSVPYSEFGHKIWEMCQEQLKG
jgi:hypothetical protein